MHFPRTLPLILAATLSLSSAAARADIFELTDGGQVSGMLLERGENEEYRIRTDSGAELTLEKSQVRKVSPVSDDLLEYGRRSRALPDTLEAHRELAQWCKERRLSKQAEHHFERILQLDPTDEEARKALGFQKFQGRWLTRDQIMELRGMRMYKGDYRTEQAIALLEREAELQAVKTDWFRSIVTWRRWLDDRRADEARALITGIQDPSAAPALKKALDQEENPGVRAMYLSTLGELRHPVAVQELVAYSLGDDDPEIRQQCLDCLLRVHSPVPIIPYVKALKSPDNEIVLRAAEALERIKDPESISPLIDALVTTHKYDNPDAAPGEMNAAFDNSGGAGFSMGGGGNKIIKVAQENSEVRMALVELSGGQDFQFNERAWRRWYVNEQIHSHFDPRRDP